MVGALSRPGTPERRPSSIAVDSRREEGRGSTTLLQWVPDRGRPGGSPIDLFEHYGSAMSYGPNDPALETYIYTKPSGEPIAEKRRYPEKKFQWWHRNGSGWASGKPDNGGVSLYRLHEIVKCNVAFIVEGEKDADRLASIDWTHIGPGVVVGCTTAPDGANTWQVEEYGPYFTGTRTYIIPDSDAAGAKYEKDVTRSVLKYAAELHMVRLPPDSKDVSEFLDHHTVDELVKLIQTAPLVEVETESVAVVDGYTLVHIGELLDRPDTPMDYIWEGRAVAGTLSLCVAKPKVGKGTIARNLALHVSRGDPLFGWATRKGVVIYLALEEREDDVKADFKALGATKEDPLWIHAAPTPDEAVPKLIELIRQQKPVLVVIDPLIRLARIRDEKAYAETYNALGPLLDVARECNTHILLLHHTTKTPKTDAIDAPLGSTAFGGVPATLLYLKRTSEGMRTIQTVQRMGDDLPETVLVFDKATKRLTLGGSRKEADQAAAETRILEYLEGSEPRTQTEIRDVVEGDSAVTRSALTQLVDRKQVVKSGAGKRGDPFRYQK